MLEIQNVSKTFNAGTVNQKTALNGLNLKLNEGDFVTVIGGNGAGKSTMLNAVAGVWPVDEGKIIIDGVDVTRLSEHQRATYIGRVFQDPMTGTAATMQIEENLALAARRGQPRGLKWGITALERADYRELLKTLDLGLEDRLTAKVGLLSGGQRQRVAIGRAIVRDPQVMLMDEALSNLDAKLRVDMRAELKRLHHETGTTIIYVTHDQEEALTMSDTVVVMNGGKVQQIGTPEDIYNEPKNAFVADFIGDSNIVDGVMHRDFLVSFSGVDFPCVDRGFAREQSVQVVVRPEDIEVVSPVEGQLVGVVNDVIFKGVHFEMHVECEGREWLIHSTRACTPGETIGMRIGPNEIHIMSRSEG